VAQNVDVLVLQFLALKLYRACAVLTRQSIQGEKILQKTLANPVTVNADVG
jgi:hypothetical protein